VAQGLNDIACLALGLEINFYLQVRVQNRKVCALLRASLYQQRCLKTPKLVPCVVPAGISRCSKEK
jgi:hypothetical protein